MRPRSIGYLAGLAVVAGVYLILREQVLSHLNGAYGDLGTLFARSTVWLNLGNNLLGLVVLPLPDGLSPTEPSPALAIRALFLIGAVVALAYAIRTQWRLVALGATCIVAGVLPGLSSGVIPDGSASGRFLYVPGMGLALMLAAGVGALRAEADEQPSWRAIGSMAGCLAVLAGGCVASVWHQAAIWRAASSLSRESIEQVHSRMVPGQKIFIPNLPFLYTDGPYVLKDSAFSYYCQGGCPGASVRARPIVLKYLDGETRYIGWAGSPPPPAAADEEEVFLQLPIRGGPVAQPSPEGAVETPAREAVVSQPFTVSGWAVDRSAVNGTGVDVIHIYAYPAGSQVAKLLGFATYGQPRPDIGRRGRRFTNAGFSFQVSGLAPGHYLIAAFPHDLVVGVFSEAMVVPVEVR